jgi:hypothetical protein
MNKKWNISKEDMINYMGWSNEERMIMVLMDMINGDYTVEELRGDYDRWELELIKQMQEEDDPLSCMSHRN